MWGSLISVCCGTFRTEEDQPIELESRLGQWRAVDSWTGVRMETSVRSRWQKGKRRGTADQLEDRAAG